MTKFTRRFRKQHLLTILLLCSSIVASLLLSETVLRFALPNSYYIWPPHLKRVFKPLQDAMPGISGQSRFVINSLGIRGDELANSDTYRILAIGGSTTECLYLDESETWPYLLQNTLNETALNHHVWVGNAGMSGRTTIHHLTAMQHLPLSEMRIDAIILLIGINDFTKRLAANESYDPNALLKPEEREKIFNSTFTAEININILYAEDPFFKRTATWQMLRKVKKMVLENNPRDNVQNVQDEAGKIYVTWREHRRQAAEIRNTLPDLSSGLEEYARNIHKMIDIAQAKSLRLIFMTQPSMWKPNLPKELDALIWAGGIGDYQRERGKVYYSAEALESGMERYNDTLLKICQSRQLECIDLSSILDKDTTVFYDDMHFNESGAQKVSNALSNHILGRGSFRASNLAK